jgi:predicted nuclease of restriction endonuclease-like (RecB) superfamily
MMVFDSRGVPMKKINENNKLINEISTMIEQSHKTAVAKVYDTLNMLFWNVGTRINTEILKSQRADYGKHIVPEISNTLTAKYGKNFEEKNLRRMMQFANLFTNEQIVVTLSRQLSWSHILVLIPLKTNEERLFYANEAITQMLGVRDLRKTIAKKTFERTAIANTQLSINSPIPQNTFKDPYFFDFLELKNGYLENDLEQAILRELENFILEFGKGFAFVERQKRMIIDGEDFYLDLLFYNRSLKRLVAIELKIGKFQAKYKGQLELYLKWLDKYEKKEGENFPIGLILCAEGGKEQVELLEMEKDGIMVAEYWTELPPKKELEQKIHSLLIEAKERSDQKTRLTDVTISKKITDKPN